MNNKELLTTQSSANQQDNSNSNSKPLYERLQIPQSPFWIIGNEDEGYTITMGKYKISHEPLRNTQPDHLIPQALRWLETNKWDVILTIALCAITDVTYKDENKSLKLQKQK